MSIHHLSLLLWSFISVLLVWLCLETRWMRKAVEHYAREVRQWNTLLRHLSE